MQGFFYLRFLCTQDHVRLCERTLGAPLCLQRVIKALNTTIAAGGEVSVSALARQAGVDRSFLYRHADLLAQIHAAQAQTTKTVGGSSVTMASLQVDL